MEILSGYSTEYCSIGLVARALVFQSAVYYYLKKVIHIY